MRLTDMEEILYKATAFVVRQGAAGTELLLFQHPYAGIQLPAGSVDPGEAFDVAAMREAREETGLTGLKMRQYLGTTDENTVEGWLVIVRKAQVYARPDVTSFNWAYIPRGSTVRELRREPGFVQVIYEEWDRNPDPQYLSMGIQGWVDEKDVSHQRIRHYYLLECTEATPQSWTVFIDNHHFRLFWAPLKALPRLEGIQQEWLAMLPAEITF